MIITGEIKMRCLEETKCGNRANKGKCFFSGVQKAFCVTRSYVSVSANKVSILFFLSRD